MKGNVFYILIFYMICALCTGCGNSQSHGEKDVIQVKIATVQAENSPFHETLLKFVEEVEKRCGDRVKITLYPNSQLSGSERDLANSVLLGSLEGAMLVDSVINSVDKVPAANIGSVPFLFSDADDFYKVMDEYLVDELNREYREIGLTNVCYIHAGAIDIENTVRPIQTPDDMKGLKIRIFDSDGLYKMLEACGGNPINMAFGEVYTGLQQGAIDGILTNSFQFIPMNFVEVTKYHTDIKAFFNFQSLSFNSEWFDSLPEDIQEAFIESGQAAYEYDRDVLCPESDAADYTSLEQTNVKVTYLTDEQREQFVEKGKTTWNYFEEKIGKNVFDNILNILGKEM